jgi:hypothetical protein
MEPPCWVWMMSVDRCPWEHVGAGSQYDMASASSSSSRSSSSKSLKSIFSGSFRFEFLARGRLGNGDCDLLCFLLNKEKKGLQLGFYEGKYFCTTKVCTVCVQSHIWLRFIHVRPIYMVVHKLYTLLLCMNHSYFLNERMRNQLEMRPNTRWKAST